LVLWCLAIFLALSSGGQQSGFSFMLNCQLPLANCYSERKLFTGFDIAAFRACEPIVNKPMVIAIKNV